MVNRLKGLRHLVLQFRVLFETIFERLLINGYAGREFVDVLIYVSTVAQHFYVVFPRFICTLSSASFVGISVPLIMSSSSVDILCTLFF